MRTCALSGLSPTTLLVAFVFSLMLPQVSHAQTAPPGPPFVTLNGQVLGATQGPAILIGGVVMMPLPDFAAAVGGQLTADMTQTRFTLKRGNVTAGVTLDMLSFQVGFDTFNFTRPPLKLGPLAYVEVKPLLEALGGQFVWNAGTMVADLQLKTTGLGPGAIKGTVAQIYPGTPIFILIKLEGAEQASPYVGADRIEYYQTGADGSLQPAAAGALKAGDTVEFVMDANNRITKLLLTRLQITGVIEGVGGGRILLTDGQLFTLAPNADVRTQDGKPYDANFLRRGDAVTLTLNPADRTVAAVTLGAAGGGTTLPPTGAPRITSVAPDATNPLKAGAQLMIRMIGTPAGQATADIGDNTRVVTLRETAAGNYSGIYTVRAGDNITDALIIGHLVVGGQRAPDMSSAQRVTLDTTEPSVVSASPDYLQEVTTLSPLIRLEYTDGTGSGIDPTKITLKLDNANIRTAATVTDRIATYQANNLTPGDHTVEIKLVDKAGNEKTVKVIFTVKGTASKIVQVQHDATRPLRAGEVLTVNMDVVALGLRAFCVLGNNWQLLDMQPVPGTKTYRARYTVKKGDQVVGAKVVGHLIDNTGREYTLEAPTAVDISTVTPTKLAITSPKDKESLKNRNVVITGQAPPNRKVKVVVQYDFFGDHDLAAQTITADANGDWKTATIDLRGKFVANFVTEFKIVAQLLDATDKVEDTQKITVQLNEE